MASYNKCLKYYTYDIVHESIKLIVKLHLFTLKRIKYNGTKW